MVTYLPTRETYFVALAVLNARVGAEVRRLRLERGIRTASMASDLGVSRSHISAIEAGDARATKLGEIASILGVTVEHFHRVARVCGRCDGCGLEDVGGGE